MQEVQEVSSVVRRYHFIRYFSFQYTEKCPIHSELRIRYDIYMPAERVYTCLRCRETWHSEPQTNSCAARASQKTKPTLIVCSSASLSCSLSPLLKHYRIAAKWLDRRNRGVKTLPETGIASHRKKKRQQQKWQCNHPTSYFDFFNTQIHCKLHN